VEFRVSLRKREKRVQTLKVLCYNRRVGTTEEIMEKQLFDFHGGWDQHDLLVFSYYDININVDLGDFPAGSWFRIADLDFGKGLLTLWNEDGTVKLAQFKLTFNLQVV
jgi:hypothetical protein